MITYDVIIVGAGHGGAQTAVALRQRRFPGTITMIGEEAGHPYERPPLSKEYLSGDKTFDRMLIRPVAFWGERQIVIQGGKKIVNVNSKLHQVTTECGETMQYGKLVWAAGGRARRLTCTGHHLPGVHSVRSHLDVDAMRRELNGTRKVAVIGGGYIGLEAAAVLTKLGKEITVLEAQNRILARVAGSHLSNFFAMEHRARGVDIRLGAQVDCIIEDGERAAGVRLSSGEVVPTDMVIVGVGITPSVDPLRMDGAAAPNGVLVDDLCKTSLTDIFAVGDCAAYNSAFSLQNPIRLESVPNAIDMATIVAGAIVGNPASYRVAPWFWSNQYDLRLQTIGLSAGFDEEVLRGDPATRSFSVIYLKAGRVVAVDAINATKDFVQAKLLVERGARPSPMLLCDPAIPLKTLVGDQGKGVESASAADATFPA